MEGRMVEWDAWNLFVSLCISLVLFVSHSSLGGSFHQPSALPVCWERRSFSRPTVTYNYLVFFLTVRFPLCCARLHFLVVFFSPLCSLELNKATSRCPSTQLSYSPSSSLICIRHVLIFHSRKLCDPLFCCCFFLFSRPWSVPLFL